MKKHSSAPFRALLSLMKENALRYAGTLISTVAIVIIGFLTPLVLAETIDCILGNEPSGLPEFLLVPIRALGGREFFRANLWLMGLILVALNVLNGAFSFAKGRLNAQTSETIALSLRRKLYDHLQKLPFS